MVSPVVEEYDVRTTAADLEALARMPSPLLVAYRLAAQGQHPERSYEWVFDLRRENPRQFAKDLQLAEKEWRQTLALLEPAKVEVVSDGGSERALELIGRALGAE